MTTIVTRAGKGSPLTWAEADANFTNLNTEKFEVSGGDLTGPIGIVAGTVSAPGLDVAGDPNTGVAQLSGPDSLAIVTGGVKGLEQDSSQRILVGGATATAQANFRSASTTRVSVIAQAVASQTADVFQATTSGGVVLAAIGAANGRLALNRAAVQADTIINISGGSNERVDTTGTARGIQLTLINAQSGALQGMAFVVESRFAGASGTMTGVHGQIVSNNAAHSVVHARDFHALSPIATTSAGVTNAYGFYSDAQKVTGVANGYCFYGVGASDVMYVAGKVGIGIDPPNANAKLDVDGAILTRVYTVATLPTATNGLRAFVSNATAYTPGVAVTGGGSTGCPVYAFGGVWLCG